MGLFYIFVNMGIDNWLQLVYAPPPSECLPHPHPCRQKRRQEHQGKEDYQNSIGHIATHIAARWASAR